MNKNGSKAFRGQWVVALLVWIGLSLAAGEVAAVAKPKLTLSKVSWLAKKHQLIVKGKLKGVPAASIEVFDVEGRLLGTANSSPFTLTVDGTQLPTVPCSVRAQAGGLDAIKLVAGNPNKACKQAPKCQITAPANSLSVKLGDPVTFTAQVRFANKHNQPKYEWDFGGGAMGESDAVNDKVDSYKRATGTTATVKFIRDNARYRVHFSAVDGSVAAMESKQYRCEDTVEITVGTPPTDVPDMTAMVTAAQQAAPKVSKDRNGNPTGNKGDLVVLPYEDMTMQCGDDTRTAPSGFIGGSMVYPGINAVVYQKDLKSPQRTDLKLKYSATSSPADPVGDASINSTSQNWPLGSKIREGASPFATASIAKSERWDGSAMPPAGSNLDKAITYLKPWAGELPTTPDQGYTLLADPANTWNWPDSIPLPLFDVEHGERMPGFDNPYVANAEQDFTGYSELLGAYQARWLPVTDVDDSGRVNPYPLLRVQAFDAGGNTVATVDAVQTSGKDFHCRECHAKGKIGAADSGNAANTWTSAAYRYSVWNGDTNSWGGVETDFVPPVFYDPVDADNQPSSRVEDQEHAALRNTYSLHDFYDNVSENAGVYNGTSSGVATCQFACHLEINEMNSFQYPTQSYSADLDAISPLPTTTTRKYDTDYSMNMHRWHGQLQYNASKDGILRDDKGVPQRWDVTKGYNSNTLFPVKDEAGNPLPMEQNCLKCHAGQREQCYRDRMYNAGVTCYQCHGDLLAVGQNYLKKAPGPDGHKKRTNWLDQPDCGSCHVGSANVGKTDASFFSAGVRKLAFAADDPSATSLPVDWGNPDASRFAAPPTPEEIQILPVVIDNLTGGTTAFSNDLRFDGPLYRHAKDKHGNVPCGACHGGAHAVWPNRDPNANDNVTAQQLQGHVGQILECNVCHDENAFKNEKDLDGGIYMTDLPPDSGVLGGPHNTHPINDPYWYRDAQDPTDTNHATSQSDGTPYGGWHNNYAQKPGKAGEDQCAACHGNDHKGTRLSRTPVDRVFDFSGFNMAKLKKAGFKKKVIKVAAGSFIGCNTCHSVATSCRHSPAGAACGKASESATASINQPPVFTTPPSGAATTFVIGQSPLPYTYAAGSAVTDPDGDSAQLTFGLSSRMDSMTIDPATGIVTIPDWNAITSGWFDSLPQTLPYTYTYIVTVKDSKGGWAYQRVPVTVSCPANLVWTYDPNTSARGCIDDQAPTFGPLSQDPMPTAVVGLPFRYVPYTATDPNQQAVVYGLTGQPNGLTIGATNGAINGTPTQDGTFDMTITADDQTGKTTTQLFTLHVCPSGQTWLDGSSNCVANHSPVITSKLPSDKIGAVVGTPYTYTVPASDADGDTLTYSLYQKPAWLDINPATGVISGTPIDPVTDYPWLNFTIVVTDGKGGIATESVVYFGVCPAGQSWDTSMNMCM